ncbi:MAG: tetratricopeptide repeat protein, partial [Casimicrobium sp.]
MHAAITNAHLGLGVIYFRLGEFSSAQKHYESTLLIAEQHLFPHIATVARNNLAEALLHLGDAERALAEIERAEKIAEHSTKRGLLMVWTTKAEILFAMKAYDQALSIFERSRETLRTYPYLELSIYVEYFAARVLAKLGRDEEAVECLKRSAAQAREAGMSAAEARALLALSQWHARAANAKDALASIESYEQAMRANSIAQLESTRAAVRSVEQID